MDYCWLEESCTCGGSSLDRCWATWFFLVGCLLLVFYCIFFEVTSFTFLLVGSSGFLLSDLCLIYLLLEASYSLLVYLEFWFLILVSLFIPLPCHSSLWRKFFSLVSGSRFLPKQLFHLNYNLFIVGPWVLLVMVPYKSHLNSPPMNSFFT